MNKYLTASQICKALGLEPESVHSLKIILDEGMPRVEVVMPLFSDKGGLLSQTLGEYRLVKKDEK